MRETFNIAQNSFLELLRQPVFLILMVASATFIVFLAITPYFGLADDVKLVKTSSLAILLLSGLFAAVIAASSSLAMELKGGTALAVLSKPINRTSFYLGKFFGIAASLMVLVYVNLIAVLLAGRMGYDAYGDTDTIASWIYYLSVVLAFAVGGFANYFMEKNFVSTTTFSLLITTSVAFVLINFISKEGHIQKFAEGLDWRLTPAVIVLLFSLWLLAAIALACSTRLDIVPTLSICIIFLFVGLVSNYFFGRMAESGSSIGTFLYTIVPNWQNFWLADAVEKEKGIPLGHLAITFAYMFSFACGVTAIGLSLFDNRELN